MHRFYLHDITESEKSLTITGEDVNHIVNVLRLRIGDEITISDGSSRDYICKISDFISTDKIGPDSKVLADIVDIEENSAELPADIILFQGFPKGDKLDTIIQKCVELGVTTIIPVMMERTVVKLDEKKLSKKLDRYNKISEAAAKQSRRGIIPEVPEVMSFKNAIEYAKKLDVILFPYEFAEGMQQSRDIINQVVNSIKDDLSGNRKRIGIFIGPEGGFADSEAKALMEEGAKVISLGHRILRTETAGMTVMSVLSFMLDD